MSRQFESLILLQEKLTQAQSIEERIGALNSFLSIPSTGQVLDCDRYIPNRTQESELILKQLSATGQGEWLDCSSEQLQQLVQQLAPVERFYREIGGLVGYQAEVLKRLKIEGVSSFEGAEFHSPYFHDITEESDKVRQAVQQGVEALPAIAEFYPLGGAADRLHLSDPKTGEELPAAKLRFGGRTLLEGLIRDLEGREELYYQLFGRRVEVPICIMTSMEKDNHRHVLAICEEHGWFGRTKELFHIFCQPLVPAVDGEGKWLWTGPGRLLLKPGGHGAIWKLARDEGIFEKLKQLGKTHALVRQINNPLAGMDYGLLAFLGIGIEKKMLFGFVSCPRLLKAAEGVNVLVEKKKGDRVERVLTNIEYCDFARFGIEDAPLEEGGVFSRFTSNTNILFADLQALEQAVEKCPYPGLLINLKPGSFTLENGERRESLIGRLESTMQNIADVFVEEHQTRSFPPQTEKTFVTYNHRSKTISTAKKAYLPGRPLQETPERAFYDLFQAAADLLKTRCGFDLPAVRTIEEVEEKGPESLFLYHPLLGPLYSTIAQKLRGGSFSLGSELQIELGQVDIEGLDLSGSLRIFSAAPRKGKCYLKQVRIENRGVDWGRSKPFWKNEFERFESVEIEFLGEGEFIAEGVEIRGGQKFVVKEGERIVLT